MPKRKKTLSILGPGRVGTTFAALLKEHYVLEYLCASKTGSAQRARRFVKAGKATAKDAHALKSDVLIIAVPDDRLGKLAKRLADEAANLDGKIVLHTSGLHSADALAPLKNRGAFVASCHPLQSISSPKEGVKRMAGSCLACDGDPRARREVRFIAKALGMQYLELAPKDKAAYHLAAAMASNYLTALVSASIEAGASPSLSPVALKNALLPLLRGTLKNLDTLPPSDALTGPIARGDVETVRAHLKLLSKKKELLNLYKTLGRQALKLAKDKGLPPASTQKLAALLK